MTPNDEHPSDGSVQREAEEVIRKALAKKLDLEFGAAPEELGTLQPDAFADGPEPTCVEIWAHQGPAKGGQKHKVMTDMCKLLYVERLLSKPCRKIFAVGDEAAISFLKTSWQGRFAREFEIELQVVGVPEELSARIWGAQRRQFR